MRKWLFNPFIYIAGPQALLAGFIIMVATALISYCSLTHFTSMGVHSGVGGTMPIYFMEQLVAWGCTVLLLYPAGLIFSSSVIRFTDVAGTLALARWPMLICALLGFGIPAYTPHQNVNDLIKSITPVTIAISLVILMLAIWMIALIVNAFILSCNVKGAKATAILIISLLLAEILSSFFIHHIHHYFT